MKSPLPRILQIQRIKYINQCVTYFILTALSHTYTYMQALHFLQSLQVAFWSHKNENINNHFKLFVICNSTTQKSFKYLMRKVMYIK